MKIIERTFQIVTNYTCNLRCTYCYEDLDDEKIVIKKLKLDDMIQYVKTCLDDLREEIINEADEDAMYYPQLEIIGGEPFMVAKELYALFDFAVKYSKKIGVTHGINIGISTNGTLLNKPICRKILEDFKDNIYLGVSIDGVKECHDACRVDLKGQGSFDDAIAGYKTAYEILGRNHLMTKSTFNRNTIKYISESAKMLFDLDPEIITMNFVYEESYDDSETAQIAMEYIKACEEYMSRPLEWQKKTTFTYFFKNGDPELSTRDTRLSDKTILKRNRRLNAERNRCGAGTAMKCLGNDNKVYPCVKFLTNLNRNTAKMDGEKLVVTDHSLDKKIKENYKYVDASVCGKCPLVVSCSDCIARAYEEGMAHDITGFYNKRIRCGFTKAIEIVLKYLEAHRIFTNSLIAKNQKNNRG